MPLLWSRNVHLQRWEPNIENCHKRLYLLDKHSYSALFVYQAEGACSEPYVWILPNAEFNHWTIYSANCTVVVSGCEWHFLLWEKFFLWFNNSFANINFILFINLNADCQSVTCHHVTTGMSPLLTTTASKLTFYGENFTRLLSSTTTRPSSAWTLYKVLVVTFKSVTVKKQPFLSSYHHRKKMLPRLLGLRIPFPVLKHLLRVCIQDACPTQLRLHRLVLRWLLSLSYKISSTIPR